MIETLKRALAEAEADPCAFAQGRASALRFALAMISDEAAELARLRAEMANVRRLCDTSLE
ncbi:MAG TPA: hypothetical protein VMV44_08130 [Rectinemataceae bacterium]|nr:hypothetical protein [Rectinemataceae bacterium]